MKIETEVFVPDSDVIGEPGDGWRVAMSTANNERGLSLRSPGRFLATADRLVRLWKRRGRVGDTAMRDRVVDSWIGARAYQLHTFATLTRLSDSEALGPESSVTKLFWSRLDTAMHETALDLLGPEGELADRFGDPAPESGGWVDGYLFSLAGPIYGGTNEIQRNTIAERLLGLPKEPRPTPSEQRETGARGGETGTRGGETATGEGTRASEHPSNGEAADRAVSALGDGVSGEAGRSERTGS